VIAKSVSGTPTFGGGLRALEFHGSHKRAGKPRTSLYLCELDVRIELDGVAFSCETLLDGGSRRKEHIGLTRTARPTTTLARAIAALLLVCLPVATLAGSNLAGSFADPPYTLAAHCDLAQPIAFINLVVVNRGDARTAAIPVTATDGAGVLRGSTTLLPIPPRAQSALLVPLLGMPSNPGAVGGTHSITISLGPFHLAPVAVTVPPTFCATQAAGAVTSSVSRSAAERAAHLGQL
jgi:hypothetical protein